MSWVECMDLNPLSENQGSVTRELFKPEISDTLQPKREGEVWV